MRLLVSVLLALAAPAVAAPPTDDLGVVGDLDGAAVPLPLLQVDAHVWIRGDLATVEVVQTFENVNDRPMHARYTFPLPPDAAVYAMTLENGRHRIEAEIQRKAQAEQIFEQAKADGHQAALLTQHRANVFTQQIAHLLPSEPVKVTLRYAHTIPRVNGDYRFHLPLVVGPRYAAPQPQVKGAPSPLPELAWTLPASPPVDPRLGPRVALAVELEAGVPIAWIDSPSHAVDIDAPTPEVRRVRPLDPRIADDQDFELRYRLAGARPAVSVSAFRGQGPGVVSLLVEPPRTAPVTDLTPREVVFVLDCSGSMAGLPLDTSKRVVHRVLDGLRPTDRVRIVRFGADASEMARRPVPATPENLRYARAFVDTLRGGGGTEMTRGIEAAFAPTLPDGTMRIVVFLTDGYIGDDLSVVRLLEQRRGDARLFALGIGNAVNRFLLDEMGRAGRGTTTIVRPDEDVEAAADALVETLAAPYLTDLRIDWGGAPVRDVTPAQTPDVFLGRAVRVQALYDRPGRFPVTLHGRVAGKAVALPVILDLPAHAPAAEALPLTWARAQIADRMHTYERPGVADDLRDRLREEVVALGLKHRLVTQWTSFVAVDRSPVVDDPTATARADVPVPPAAGVPATAWGGGFAGHGAPEPPAWLGLLLAMAGAAWWFRRRAQPA